MKQGREARQVPGKFANLEIAWWQEIAGYGIHQKVARKAPAKARATARTLQVVAFSFRKTVARMKMKMVLSWLRAEATEAKVYFIPPIQNISDR